VSTLLTNALAAVQSDASLPFRTVTLAGDGETVEVSSLVKADSTPDDGDGKREVSRVSLAHMSNAAILAGLGRRLKAYDTATVDGTTYTLINARVGHVATDADGESGNYIERTGRSLRA